MSRATTLLLLSSLAGAGCNGGMPIGRSDDAGAADAAGDGATMDDAAVGDAALPVDAATGEDAGGDDGGLDAGGPTEEWPWARSWPGLVFEGTPEVPAARIDLPIPGGATIQELEVTYSVEVGVVQAGFRHQLDFTCADARHPYRGGLFGFLFLANELGSYVFRNGRPGEGATAPTRIPFRGAPRTELDVHLRWDAVAGAVTITVTDDTGAAVTRTSTEKVEPTLVAAAITIYLGYSIATDQEAHNIGWRYSDLTVRAGP